MLQVEYNLIAKFEGVLQNVMFIVINQPIKEKND